MKSYDVIIVGAGAAGLMCAIEAGKRGRRVLIVDHTNKVGKKILMSGGGRCNFTNLCVEPKHYLSANPHFCKSALNRYTASDFIRLVESFKIAYHEKSHGQLFCDTKASEIVKMLLACCEQARVTIELNRSIQSVTTNGARYQVVLTTGETVHATSLVVATGGLSIPTMGASPFGYQLAVDFGLTVLPNRPGLVPFTLQPVEKQKYSMLSGIALPTSVSCNNQQFDLDMLFTHRGLSGPAMLQISSFWQPGDTLAVSLEPGFNWQALLTQQKLKQPAQRVKNFLEQWLPKRLVAVFLTASDLEQSLQQCSEKKLNEIANSLSNWQIKPNNTEGYRTAEVTLGGVDTSELSSQTMEAKNNPGLFFIGEVVDVTGWLGGYNFQWAWSSGWAAGQVV